MLKTEKNFDNYFLTTNFLVNDSSITDTTYTIRNLDGNKTYYWRISGIYDNDDKHWSDTISFSTVPITDILEEEKPEDKFQIKINPNPVYDIAQIALKINNPGNYTIKIIDILGNEIYKIIEHDYLSVGTYTYGLNFSNLQQGIYFLLIKDEQTIKIYNFVVIQ